MIDTSKLQPDWGYMNLTPHGPTPANTDVGNGTTASAGTSTGTSSATGGTMANTDANFKYPDQWQQASDLWSQMANGTYSNQGLDYLSNWLSGGGLASKLGEWGAAQKPAMMDEYSNMVKQMAEQAGVGGARYGSGLQQSIANYGGQLQNKFQSDLMNQMMNAYGQDVNTAAGMGQFGLNAAQTGGQGLMGLGSLYSQLPLQVASMMGGLGGNLTSQQIDPWTQMLAGLMVNTNATEQTYTPSGLQSFLTNLLPGLSYAFANGGNSSGGTTLSPIPGASIW